MSDRSWIEPIVERVVGEILESRAAELRSEIVQRVSEEIAAQQPESSPSMPESKATDLARAVADIQLGSSQKEILRALLDAASRFATRVALFVVKGHHATGWQARGFAENESIKDFALDANAAAVQRAIVDRMASSAASDDFDARFFEQFGRPERGEACLLPLMLKDKVAAVIYADGGSDVSPLDAGALEVLVLSASAWLEVNALRKHGNKETGSTTSEAPVAAAHAPSPAFNDPFAGHSPAYAMAAAASAGSASAPAVQEDEAGEATAAVEVQSAAVESPVEAPAAVEVGSVHMESPAAAPESAAAVSPQDEEVVRKAQRFARLLVDEIKLYNQAKVAEGRKSKDLYDRLKDVIEKSRATYQKRYDHTVAASGNYFQHELVRILAEDDASSMGPNFNL